MTYQNSWGRVLLSSVLAATLCACSEDNKTQTANLSTPVETAINQKALKNASDLPHYLNRSIQDEVFYFVLPDRFYNGNTDNDNGSKTIKLSQGGFDPSNKAMYHGGDIPGLKAKLPYLKDMGISAIWLTPIMRNQALQGDSSGYHGYWILDFTEIDPHLGSNDDLKAFIDVSGFELTSWQAEQVVSMSRTYCSSYSKYTNSEKQFPPYQKALTASERETRNKNIMEAIKRSDKAG